MNTIRIVVLGDSNSVTGGQGGGVTTWPSVLLGALINAYPSQVYTMQNSAVAGRSAPYFMTNLTSACLAFNPHVVVAMLGTNDTYDTLAAYEAAMRSIIEGVLAHDNGDGTVPRIVLLQPPIAMGAVYGTRSEYTGYISDPWVAGNPYTYGRPRTIVVGGVQNGAGGLVEFKNKVSALGVEYSAPVASVWDDMAALGWSGLQNVGNTNIMDGVHLTTAGNAVVASSAKAAVETLLDALGAVDYYPLDATASADHIALSWIDAVSGENGWYVERRVAG